MTIYAAHRLIFEIAGYAVPEREDRIWLNRLKGHGGIWMLHFFEDADFERLQAMHDAQAGLREAARIRQLNESLPVMIGGVWTKKGW